MNHIETRETNWRLRRQQARAEKRQRHTEIRQQLERAARSRAATQLSLLMANIEAEVTGLEAHIAAELQTAAVKDPAHDAFRASTRSMIARRDNLVRTVRALSERAASMAGSDANADGAGA